MPESRKAQGKRPAREKLSSPRDRIKRQIDYRAFYLRYCPDAHRSGRRLYALCPIPSHGHSGNGRPSLSIDLAKGLFNCFSRHEGGDAFAFYQLMHGVSFAQAVRAMARDLSHVRERKASTSKASRAASDENIFETEELAPLTSDQMRMICRSFLEICRDEDQREGVNYLLRRGIDEETVHSAGVTYFPRKAYRRVMRRMLELFPGDQLQRAGIFNQKEHLSFYRHRLLFPFLIAGEAGYLQARTIAAGIEPRWHNMRGSVPALYNIDAVENVEKGSVVYLVEGITDTLTLASHGFTAVGLVGAGGLKKEWLGALEPFGVVAVLDPDYAGRWAAARYEESFANVGRRLGRIFLPSDVNDFFRQRSSAGLEFELLTEAALDTATSVDLGPRMDGAEASFEKRAESLNLEIRRLP
jgi:DNA primase